MSRRDLSGAVEASDQPPCVLVIDEHSDLVKLIRDVLEGEGFGTVGTTEPEEARILARRIHPDLFVIDITLKRVTGLELLIELRELSQTDAPAIGITGYTYWERIARQSGLFQSVMGKPFDGDELIEEARRLTGWHQEYDQLDCPPPA